MGAPTDFGTRLETRRADATGEMAWRPAMRPFGVRKLASAFQGDQSGSKLPHSKEAIAGRGAPGPTVEVPEDFLRRSGHGR